MPSTTIRIGEQSHRILRRLAEVSGESMQSVAAKAIEEYRRRVFLDRLNEEFAALRRDPVAWKEELEERKAWEATLADGEGNR